MDPLLYPQLETSTAPLDDDPLYDAIIRVEKDIANSLKDLLDSDNICDGMGDTSFLPQELFVPASKRDIKKKIDPLKRIKDIATNTTNEEAEDEEETADEDAEDEESVVEDEEDDAGGDYLVTHFDNGEGFEDNDDEGDEGGMI